MTLASPGVSYHQMSPVKEVRPFTPEETKNYEEADREEARKEKEQMEKIESFLVNGEGVAVEFYRSIGGFGEYPDVFEQIKDMRIKILKHFRTTNSQVLEENLDFGFHIQGKSDKGTLFVRVIK